MVGNSAPERLIRHIEDLIDDAWKGGNHGTALVLSSLKGYVKGIFNMEDKQ